MMIIKVLNLMMNLMLNLLMNMILNMKVNVKLKGKRYFIDKFKDFDYKNLEEKHFNLKFEKTEYKI